MLADFKILIFAEPVLKTKNVTHFAETCKI